MALLTQLLPKGCSFLRRQMPIHGQRIIQLLHLVRRRWPTRCFQRRAQLGTPLFRRRLNGGRLAIKGRLRVRTDRDNRHKQEKPKMLHSANITPKRIAPFTLFSHGLGLEGNICNIVSTLAPNSAIGPSNPAKSVLLQIEWYLHEPSPQPQ